MTDLELAVVVRANVEAALTALNAVKAGLAGLGADPASTNATMSAGAGASSGALLAQGAAIAVLGASMGALPTAASEAAATVEGEMAYLRTTLDGTAAHAKQYQAIMG